MLPPMFEHRSKILGLSAFLHDFILTALAFPLAYWVREHLLPRSAHLDLLPVYPLLHYVPLWAGILLLWPVTAHLLGLYRRVELRNPLQILWDVVRLVVLCMVLLLTGLYLGKADVSRSLVVTFGIADGVLLAGGRLTLFFAKARLREMLGRYHYFLIVGTGRDARELAHLVEHAENLGLRLVGFVNPGKEGAAAPGDLRRAYPVISLDEVPVMLHSHVVDEVLIAVDKQELDRLEPLLLHCEREGVKTRIHLNFLPPSTSRVYLERLDYVPLLTFSTTPHDEVALFAKRSFDVIASALALVVLAPLFLVIAVLVRITTPGPVFYCQTRCGLGGRRFTMYKFRSMVANAESLRPELERLNEADGPIFKMSNDPRVTPLGRGLRRSSLDELPQLWNILRGDMSFVGPRPPVPEEVEKYESWQRRRLRMRPGLTCLWALEGRSRLSFDRWMQLDLSYIDAWSLWLDAKIFLQTIPRVLFGRGAW